MLVRSRSSSRRLGAALVCVALAGWLPLGCAATGASLVERGEEVKSGERRFDAYFERVAALRAAVGDLDDNDLFPVREPLIVQLDVDVEASLPALMAATRKAVDKARDYGLSMGMLLQPQPRVVTVRGELEAGESQERLVRAIEESANRAMSSFKQYNKLLSNAATLEADRAELAERIDGVRGPADTRSLLERELVASGRVLAAAERRLLQDSRTLALFLVALAESVDTGALATEAARCEEAMARGPKRPQPVPGPRRPPPPAPPQPARGDDFEM